jgi:hypothetical protein
MTHTEKATLYLAKATEATIMANASTGWTRIDHLVAASNFALLASQELAVAHEGATALVK